MHILFICREFSNNALGRAYCLWLLARAGGHTTTLLTTSPGEIWEPLRAEGDFTADCTSAMGDDGRALLRSEARRADVVVAVKPLPESLGVALEVTRDVPRPLLVDIDDPDLEVRLPSLTRRGRVGAGLAARHENPALHRLHEHARRLPAMVSNPTLQNAYGGHLVPHARNAGLAGAPHVRSTPVVAFVGTPNPHKGLSVLRSAVEHLAARGFTLVVTAAPPPDARPHEQWVGTTGLAEGLSLLRDADIVAIPSLGERYGPGQLPVKLVDAMLAARAVVVSDLAPLQWAGGGSVVVVPAGSVSRLAGALQSLAAPGARQRLGELARARGLSTFTVDAVTPAFEAALDDAVRRMRS